MAPRRGTTSIGIVVVVLVVAIVLLLLLDSTKTFSYTTVVVTLPTRKINSVKSSSLWFVDEHRRTSSTTIAPPLLLADSQQQQQQQSTRARRLSSPLSATSTSDNSNKNNKFDEKDDGEETSSNNNNDLVTASTTSSLSTFAEASDDNESLLVSSIVGMTPAATPQFVKIVGGTTSLIVALAVFFAIAWQRDAVMVSLFVGSLGNAVLSKVLKKVIRQDRPAQLRLSAQENTTTATSSSLAVLPTSNGMPSSHAMSLAFLATFFALVIQSPIVTLGFVLYVVTSLYYRVQVNLHTTAQVVVGSLLGGCNGYIWWHFTTTANNNPLGISLADWIQINVLGGPNQLIPWQVLPVLGFAGLFIITGGDIKSRALNIQAALKTTKPTATTRSKRTMNK